MKLLKNFKEYVEKGIVKKHFPDKSKAQDLIEDSDKADKSLLEIVNKIGINDINSNTIIKESYDAIMSLIRSKMLLKGFSASGIGAHESEVSYLRELKFSESEVEFMNQLRYFRNGIMYYGKHFDKEYAKKVFKFMKNIVQQLKNY